MRFESEKLLANLGDHLALADQRVADLEKELRQEREISYSFSQEAKTLRDKSPDAADLQLICLALAELALHRPGMAYAVDLVVEKIGGEQGKYYLAGFKQTSADLAKPYEEFKRIGRGADPKDDPAAGG